MDPFYARLGVSPQDRPCTVLRATIRALHPSLRRMRGLRVARQRFYRAMLASHARLQTKANPVGAD
ncbi:hypothetical protein [Roseinatronobacter sp. S2]|uniref:hypothetical protein n=1 Tax=Roseinatronobacter sp. S2 TaxID=3035471 RepID=UPI00240ED4DB|nr:hypothetical protein [Roseinatronobacter sp. S2]WFE77171.1 hypothetical protein P8S53_20965 [Roseinatronobacter sp. S2]